MEISLIAGMTIIIFILFGLLFLLLFKQRKIVPSPKYKLTKEKKPEHDKVETDKLLHSYFKGLSYVLSNDTDRAVAEFIKVAQVSSATSEIYLALGQLFRKTGEVERAIRIHRNLLLRSSLPDNTRLQTIFEIGLDYKQAGLIDRARQTFEELHEEAPTFIEALTELGSIYELCREWDKAIEVQKKLASLGDKESKHVLAHLTTEMAKEIEQQEDYQQAMNLYQRAIEIYPGCVDAWLHLGDLHLLLGREAEAINAWEKGFSLNPDLTFMTVSRLAAFPGNKSITSQEIFFQKNLDQNRENANFLTAYINFLIEQENYAAATSWIVKVLDQFPDCLAIFNLTGKLITATGCGNEYQELLQRFFGKFQPVNKPYQCNNCGCFLEEIVWKCPKCAHWDTVIPR